MTPGKWFVFGPDAEGKNPNMGLWNVESDFGVNVCNDIALEDARFIAAAPETAAERDALLLELAESKQFERQTFHAAAKINFENDTLLAANRELKEALEAMVRAATYGTFDHSDSHPLPLARKALARATGASS